MNQINISISIVSHSQAALVNELLVDLSRVCRADSIEVLLTLNVPEELPFSPEMLPFALKIIHNDCPLGFGENHNRAFALASGGFFCVVNPDIRIDTDVFPSLLSALRDESIGVVAPMVVNSSGTIEDSARRFPTPLKIVDKVIGVGRFKDYEINDVPIFPDWVGGMFMMFRRRIYEELGGFDQKFFLYYEDVDICARIWLKGLRVMLVPQVKVIHNARRSSHKKARYLLIHISSMMRFFLSMTYLRSVLSGTRR